MPSSTIPSIRKLSLLSALLLIGLALALPAQPALAVTIPANYYLIAIGTTAGDTIGNVDDTASGAAACSLRDAANIVTAGTTAGPVTGCDITAIGTPDAANPVYVINYPANLVYTIDMVTPLDEIDIAYNPVYILGTDPTTDIIQGDDLLPINSGSRMFNFFQSDSFLVNLTLRYGDGRGREGANLINRVGTLTLENVRIYGANTTAAGAGLANTNGGTLNIIAGSIIGNQAEPNVINGTLGVFGGAGVLNWNATMLIEDSTVHYNTTAQMRDGGGIYNAGTLTIRNSVIAHNTLTAVSGADGAGIYNRSTLIIEGGQIHSNTTNGNGGGIYNGVLGQTTISGGTVIGGNGTPNSASEGGGIYNQLFGLGGFVRILDAEISYNTTGRGGGGIFNDGGPLEIGSPTHAAIISHNVAGSINGGGIYSEDGVVNITNTTMEDNEALGGFGRGGAIYNVVRTTTSAVANISDSVLNSNDARLGGAIYNAGDGAVLTLDNTAVTNNTTGNGGGGGIMNDFFAQMFIQNGSVIGGVGNGNIAGFNGGGILNLGSTMTIADSEVSFNTSSDGSGGGITNHLNTISDPDTPSSLIITNSQITDNRAINGGVFDPFAGGIYNVSSNLTMIDSALDRNEAANGGGGLLNEDGTVIIHGGTVSENIAGGDGGGILNRTLFGFGELTTSTSLNRTTLLDNTATGNGGAIFNHVTIFGKTAVVVVRRATIGDTGVGNTAALGGAIYNMSNNLPEAAEVRVSRSYIINNSDGIYHDNADTRVIHSCIEDNGAGFTNITPGDTQNATDNWWGAADGPSDLGGSSATGSGDGVTDGVDFTPFNTLGCMEYPPGEAPVDDEPVIDEPVAVTGGGEAPVTAFSDPAISKAGAPASATVGEEVVWTVRVWNPGSTPTDNLVFVRDPIPDMFDITDATATRGVVSIEGQEVRVEIGVLQPGEEVIVTITTVANSLAEAGQVCNTASADWNSTFTATGCVAIFPDALPPTGGEPVAIPWAWLTLALIALGAGGYALRRRRWA